MTAPTLTFSAVDDLAFAAARGRLHRGPPIPATVATELGPYLELWHLATAGLVPSLDAAPWLALDGIRGLHDGLGRDRESWIGSSQRLGFLRAEATQPQSDRAWVEFGIAVQRAIGLAGFARTTAHQLLGALGELLDNIYEHSRAPASGLVAFKAGRDEFEFAVCDRGVGVLESLRTNPDYAVITDHGEALERALHDGVSRFKGVNRGWGFRPLFLGLANLNGALRFRSGDHAVMIDGRSPSVMSARRAQKPFLPGFFVSVSCRPDSRAADSPPPVGVLANSPGSRP